MKTPGSAIVHVVDHSGHCVPAIARGWHDNGTIDFTVFTVPGSITAARGVPYKYQETSTEKSEHTWHYECENEDPAPSA